MTYYTKPRANAPNGTFSTLYFATVREREGRDCLVANTIYLISTKLLGQGNKLWVRKTPSNRSNLPLKATAHFKFMHSTF